MNEIKKGMRTLENLVVKEYLGNSIQFKMVDGHVYANATTMCKVFNKKVNDWTRMKLTEDMINEVSTETGIPATTLILVNKGGIVTEQGTWIHEELILELASGLNVKFRRWTQQQIATLLREGKVEVKQKQLSPAEFLLQQAQLMVDMEKRVTVVEKDVNRLEHNIRRTQTQDHFTIIAYANMKGIKAKSYNSSSMGKKATKICKERNLVIGKVVDSKYGLINTYPEEVLDEIFLSI